MYVKYSYLSWTKDKPPFFPTQTSIHFFSSFMSQRTRFENGERELLRETKIITPIPSLIPISICKILLGKERTRAFYKRVLIQLNMIRRCWHEVAYSLLIRVSVMPGWLLLPLGHLNINFMSQWMGH